MPPSQRSRQLQQPMVVSKKNSLPSSNSRGSTQSLIQARHSPKRSPKLMRANTEIKDYGPIDGGGGGGNNGQVYPPHSAKYSFSRLPQSGIRPPSTGSMSGLPTAKGRQPQVQNPLPMNYKKVRLNNTYPQIALSLN